MKVEFRGKWFTEAGGVAEPFDIVAFQKICHVDVPADYLEFLTTVNGGVPLQTGFTAPITAPIRTDNSDSIVRQPVKYTADPVLNDVLNYAAIPNRIDCFFGLGRSARWMDLVLSFGSRRLTTTGDASSLIPIAGVKSGGTIYLSVSDDWFGKVYQDDEDIEFSTEYGPVTRLDEMGHLLLCESFGEFVGSLFPAVPTFPQEMTVTDAHWRLLELGGYVDSVDAERDGN